MNFDLFRAFVSGTNVEAMTQASEFLKNSLGNPELAKFIISTYSTPEVQNDPLLPRSMAIILFHIVNFVWKNGEIFNQYDKQIILSIRNQIIPLLLNSNPATEQYLLDSVKIILKIEDIAAQDLIDSIYQFLQTNQTIQTFYFAFSIFEAWADIVTLTQKDGVDRLNPFFNIILQIWSQVQQHLQPSALVFKIIEIGSSIFSTLLKKGTTPIQNPIFLNASQFFLQVLTIEANDESISNCIQMKKSILSFFTRLFSLNNEFVAPLQQNFIPQIINIFPQIYQTVVNKDDTRALGALLFMVYGLLVKNCNVFYTSDFVNNVLIPSSKLTSEDLEIFNTSAEQYIGQSFYDYVTSDNHSPREICGRIAAKFITVNPDAIFSFNPANGTPLDLESWLYLIGQGYTNLFDSENSTMNPNLYRQIFSLLQNPNQPIYLIPTILYALKNGVILQNDELLSSVAQASYQILLSSKHPVISVMALELFRTTIISLCEKEIFDQLVNIEVLIQKTLEIAQNIHTDSVAIVLQLLTKYCPETILPYSSQLLSEILSTWFQISNFNQELTEEQETEVDELIHAATLIVDIQEDQTILSQLSNELVKFAFNAMTNYPKSYSIQSIIKLCIILCQKLTTPNEAVISLIPFSANYLFSFEEACYLLHDFAGIYCALMPHLNQEMVQAIIGICNQFLSNPEMEETILGAALVILADIIEVHGVFDLVSKAVEFMLSDVQSMMFIGCVYVLTAALFKSEGQFASQIPPDVLQIWFESANISIFSTPRDVHTCAVGLLFLAKVGIADALQAAYLLLNGEYQKQNHAGDEMDMEMGFEEEDDFMMDDEIDENSLITTAATIPTDSVSHSELFLQITAQTNTINNFDPGFINNLKKLATS
ncbi:hypothetical protein TRFO_36731 [Tritrichomonas foetus]|uniref:Importin N-terminal domain-containing protein n=1 Tax=Tritrichomonas foetus TaxID=1144522 RepID=A0A1J4JFQ5_9EUKA|nr:hypothetical protein TRFO_36731 [Tritrichomonas foetus]|eukprot:OHS97119.1 hypothetical protein TRFO_36731 [Tritrichomonas foetus]